MFTVRKMQSSTASIASVALKRQVGCIVAIVLVPHLAFAFTGSLTNSDIETAIQAGKNIAKRGQGFNVKSYTIAQETNGIDIAPGSIVDAVVLRTPFEHLVYESYLKEFEGGNLTVVHGEKLAKSFDRTVQVVIYAHSPQKGPSQRSFLSKFHNASLVVGEHKIHPMSSAIHGLAEDFFEVKGAGRQFRWLGERTYTFNLSNIAPVAFKSDWRFIFFDSVGRQHSYSFKLSQYR